MSRGLRDDERQMRRLADFPLDRGQQEFEAANAAAREAAVRGYRPAPTEEAIRRKFALEAQADVPQLLRLRELLEGTCLTAQEHPLQDAPFFAENLNFSSGEQTIAPSTTDGIVNLDFTPNDGNVPTHFIAVVRTLAIVTFDAAAEDDLRISVRYGGAGAKIDQGTFRLRPSAFPNFRRNVYYRVMQNQALDFLITNNSAVLPHDVRIEANGWLYPLADVKETARGIIPRLT